MTDSNSLHAVVALEGLKQLVGDVSTGSDITIRLPLTSLISSNDLKMAERDCELLLQKLRQYPKEIAAIFDCVSKSDVKEAVQIARKIGFTETEFKNAGGDMMAFLVAGLVGLAIVLWASDAF